MRKLIGICGQPGHGKTTVQNMLELFYGVRPFDDGLPIREALLERYPFLSWEDVTTEKGKASIVELPDGQRATVRKLLGDLGKEREDGEPGIWAKLAVERALSQNDTAPASFGSVRRSQGSVYRKHGGIVVEVVDPRKPRSPHDFDQYERAHITHVVRNDGNLFDLAWEVHHQLDDYFKEGA